MRPKTSSCHLLFHTPTSRCSAVLTCNHCAAAMLPTPRPCSTLILLHNRKQSYLWKSVQQRLFSGTPPLSAASIGNNDDKATSPTRPDWFRESTPRVVHEEFTKSAQKQQVQMAKLIQRAGPLLTTQPQQILVKELLLPRDDWRRLSWSEYLLARGCYCLPEQQRRV